MTRPRAPRAPRSRLLRWYFALKYRVFRRERRPHDGRRGLVMLQIDALAVRRAASRDRAGLLPDDLANGARRGLHAAALVLRAAVGDAVLPGRNLLRRERRAFPRFASTTRPSGASSPATRRRACSTSATASTAPGALAGGSSYVNLLDGDAQTVAFTVATRERMSVFQRLGGWRMALLILLHPIRMAAHGACRRVLEWLREEYERTRRRAGAEAHAQRRAVSVRSHPQQRHRARAADDGDSARRLPRRADHLQHVHAVRRARSSLRPVELSGVARSSPHRRAHSRDSPDDRERRAAASTTSSSCPITG